MLQKVLYIFLGFYFFSHAFNLSCFKSLPATVWDDRDCSSAVAATPQNKQQPRVINGVAVPADFPVMKPQILTNETAPGRLFLSSRFGPGYIMVLENDGTPYFYRRMPGEALDFKPQPTGLLTWFDYSAGQGFTGMDSCFRDIADFRCVNGFNTDEHEMVMLPDGRYFLIAKGYHYKDMRALVPGGVKNAMLYDQHIQEFDRDGNLLFQWLCTDYFHVLDAAYEDLTQPKIDYVHLNSIALDYDGHLVISSRNLSEVTKINRDTGELMWRFGGRNNQFRFTGADSGFFYQHCVRPVAGKKDHYLLFDNGNHHQPPVSRAVEYVLDPIAETAERVWEFRHPSDFYAPWMGSVQRLPNGNTLINWGGGDLPVATEVTPEGRIVYEAYFENGCGCYRTFRSCWQGNAAKPVLMAESWQDRVILYFNKFGDQKISNYRIYGGKNPEHLSPMLTTSETFVNLTALDNFTTYYLKVCAVDTNGIQSDFSEVESVFVHYYQSGDNLIRNGDFRLQSDDWIFQIDGAGATGEISAGGVYHINIQQPGDHPLTIQLRQNDIPMVKGRKYTVEFDAWAFTARSIIVTVTDPGPPQHTFMHTGPCRLKPVKRRFSYTFETQHDSHRAQLRFNFGGDGADVWLDNITLHETPETRTGAVHGRSDGYQLRQNYPNPFNNRTRIDFSVPEACSVSLHIYNILGECVYREIGKLYPAGRFFLYFEARNLPTGLYYYKLDAKILRNGYVHQHIKKMLILK